VFPDVRTVAALSDGELLARFTVDRDEMAEIAFAALVRRHGPMVLRVCQQILGDRHTAEDTFQATFLILARKADSIHQPELLAHWLHGVALRTAREARMRDHRRRQREVPSSNSVGAEPIDHSRRPDRELDCREEFEALHDEVSRLPERYRIPVVLCDLEGLSYQEAANRLRCPVGTIGVRLRRARQRLRERLTHRGLAPTAGLIGAFLSADAAMASLSNGLVESTVSAALSFAAKSAATTGLASSPVVALTESVLRAMAIARAKLAIGIAVAVGVASTAGWLGAHRNPKQLIAPARAASIPEHRVLPPVVAAPPGRPAPESARAPQRPAEPVRPAKPISPAKDKPPPADLLAAVVGGRALASVLAKDQFDAAEFISGGLVRSIPQSEWDRPEEWQRPAGPPAPRAAAKVDARARGEQEWGQLLFAKEWVPNDPMSRGGDGLGPVYNETSCVACHGLGGPGGAGPETKNVVILTAASNGCGAPGSIESLHPGFRNSQSAVIHRYGTDPGYSSWRRRFFSQDGQDKTGTNAGRGEATIFARIKALKEQTELDRRMRTRNSTPSNISGFVFNISERNTPQLFGVGDIDAIPTEALIAAAESQRMDVRGRVNRVKGGAVGRFGWKAQVASLHEFVRGACANELGLEVPGHSQPKSPLAPKKQAANLDMTEAECDALVAYVRALPAPVAIDPAGMEATEDIRQGGRLFASVRCTACHTPSLGDVQGIYSDLLLHDMGQSLSDSGSTYGMSTPTSPGAPKPREWRTPPLWGFRDSGPYLHDGRAQNLEEAVALHEGQAKKSAHAFFALSATQRAQVEAFLKSLIAPPVAAAREAQLASDGETEAGAAKASTPETIVRQLKESAVAHDEAVFRGAKRERIAREAAKRARVQIPIAESMERAGRYSRALAFYRDIAQRASGTDEGRLATRRIMALSAMVESVAP
jgi:RNA polymerase sigma factor (sigma-70 family)